jgi:protein TonB
MPSRVPTPLHLDKTPEPTPEPVDTPPDLTTDPGDENLPIGDPNGVTEGGVIGALAVPNLSNIASSGEEAVPFGSGMSPPQLLSSGTLQYTREALAAHVSGTAVAKCVITRTGEVEDCRIIKGQPHMDEAVLEHLYSRRYSPVLYQGKPVAVSYVFTIRLTLK